MSDPTITITEFYVRMKNETITRVRFVGKELLDIVEDFPIILFDPQVKWIEAETMVTGRELQLFREVRDDPA